MNVDWQKITDDHICYAAYKRSIKIPCSSDQAGEDNSYITIHIHRIGVNIIVIKSSERSCKTSDRPSEYKGQPFIKIGIIPEKTDSCFILFDRSDHNPI